MKLRKIIPTLLTSLILINATDGISSTPSVAIPNPVLALSSREPYSEKGKQFIRYKFLVENFAEFPAELFAAAPGLPPCGTNTKASRTWVDVYDSTGARLNGFCAFSKPDDLNTIWFGLEES